MAERMAGFCARCHGEIPREPFSFESEDGAALCESCFRKGEMPPEPQGRRFFFLRVMAALLRIVAVLSMVGSLSLLHFRYAFGAGLQLYVAISGIIIFIACITLSELIRLGLSLEERVEQLIAVASRLDETSGSGGKTETITHP